MEQDVLSDTVDGGEDRQEAYEYQGSAEYPVVDKIPTAHDGELEELGAQSFLVSADLISGAEIVAMVRTLNANVFQTAALIADTLECALVDGMPRGEPLACLGFGDTIKRLLASADSAAVQIALQTAIARWCKQKIESWCLKDRRLSHHLSGLYEKIWHTETQATAGRWRALTRANTKRSDEESLLTNSLIDWVFDVMLAAGWNIEDAEGIASLEERFGGQISAIVKYSLQLRKAIGEGMVSEEFEVLFIEPNRTFDGKTMEDAEAIRRTDETPINQVAFEVVACTSDIGLQRRSRNGNLESTGVLLRPKVFLESAFQEI
ncbi:hypothetical protein B0H11DRAFT_1700456 [Mycena galericulata]|nr:hypothetical protein B0H11DRAFT_1700456 [Mycena galericulata]